MAEHPDPSRRQIAEALLDRRAVVVLALLRRVEAAADVLELAEHLRNLIRAAGEETAERGVGELLGSAGLPNRKIRVDRESGLRAGLAGLNIAPRLPKEPSIKAAWAALSRNRGAVTIAASVPPIRLPPQNPGRPHNRWPRRI